jgi:transposase
MCPAFSVNVQIPCRWCGKLTSKLKDHRNRECRSCGNAHRHPPRTLSTPSSSNSSSSSSSLFEHDPSSHTHLTELDRLAIVVLHYTHHSDEFIAHTIHCSVATVKHWLNYWKEYDSVKDVHRSGRKRKLEEQEECRIGEAAYENPFITPKQIRQQLQLNGVCTRTVRRRLNDSGLYGRIAKKQPPFTDRHRKNDYRLRKDMRIGV